MKKLFLLFIMMFAVFGFVACNNGGSDVEISYDEQIAFPTNLSIDGKILNWNAVADATGYDVYVDGEKVKTVKTTSYDFSSLDGSRLIFTVVTLAPRGMQDSEHSVSIAYMANKTAEIAAMKLAVSTSDMPLTDEFAEELVNKGMLASEFEAMVDALKTFSESTDTIDNPTEAYTAIDTMMDSMVNMEAVISAFVKTMLPDLLDEQIASLESDITYYQTMIDSGYDYWGDFQDRVDEYNTQIDMLTELKTTISASQDNVIKTILFVFDYIMSIEEMVTADLITKITTLSETEGIEDLNVNEVVLIKEEIVNILTETMPLQSELVLVINTLNSLAGLLENIEGVEEVGTIVYPEKMAGSMLLSFDAYIKYIDNFDLAFFTELKAIGTSNDSEYTMQAKIATLVITYFDNFLEENEDLLDEIDAVYTDEEKELMYNDAIAMLEDSLSEQGFSPITDLSFLSFDLVMALEVIFDDAFNDLLDAFVASEGEILMLIAEMQEYEDEFWSLSYMEQDWDEYDYNSTIYQFKIMDQAAYLMNSIVSGRTQADFEEVRGLFIAVYKETITFFMEGATFTEIQSTVAAIDAFLLNTTEEQYTLIQSIFAFVDEEDIFLDYANAYETLYADDFAAMNSEDSMYFQVAFAIDAYNIYMTSANRANINAIIDEVVILLAADVFADAGLETYPGLVTDLLDYIDTIDAEVAGFDYTNLTTANKARLDEIMTEIETIVMQP
jgi:hypothetical protein